MPSFSLDRFESCIDVGAHDEAIRMLHVLDALLRRWPYSDLGSLMSPAPPLAALPAHRQREAFVDRASAALATWLSDPRLELTAARMQQLLALRPLIWRVFAATPSGNADHVTSKFLPPASDQERAALPRSDAAKRLCLLFNSESRLTLDIRALWELDRHAAVSLCIGITGELFPGSALAHARRENWLEWLAVHIDEIDDPSHVEASALWALYMHCTYARGAQRHAVKRGINTLVRAELEQFGITDISPADGERHSARTRPLMLVIPERLVKGHSIARTHSRTLSAARQHFEVVALCMPGSIDEEGQSIFDRTYDLPSPIDIASCVRHIREFAQQERPDVLYMPSVGMAPLTIFLSNLRLAPLQIAGLGHPATTHASRIDYVSVEDDFVGDPSCFSEKLLRLPKDGQPYQPSALLETITPRIPDARPRAHIAVAASMMKLHPSFLEACRRIVERSESIVHLHFLTSGSTVLTLMHLSRILARTLTSGSYTIHGFEPYAQYVNSLNQMDMFLSPFPFGNTNGIVDAFTVGLPGICKTGQEVFERIDGALFARAWMPGWMVADTEEEYVEAAVRLATNRRERESLRASMIERNVVQRLFEGRPEVFGEMVLDLLNRQAPVEPPPLRTA